MLTKKDLTEIVRLLNDNSEYWLNLAEDMESALAARDNAEHWGLRAQELANSLEALIPKLVAGSAEPISE